MVRDCLAPWSPVSLLAVGKWPLSRSALKVVSAVLDGLEGGSKSGEGLLLYAAL